MVDGSPQARRAVSVVVELTLRTRASILVIPQPGPGDDNNKAGWTADSVARYAVDRLVSAGVDAGTNSHEQPGASGLSEAASSFDPDFVVVPADDHGDGPGLELLQRINVPFLVVGPGAAEGPIGSSVAVALLDGSDFESAVEGATEIAGALGARVMVMHMRALAPRVSTIDVELDLVEQAVAKLRKSGVSATGRVLPQTTDSARSISAAAAAEGVGLIVVNSRRIHGLRAWLAGNVASKLVKAAGRPILLTAKRAA